MATQLKIIVVEDHDALREVTVVALGSMGHIVRGVECAEDLDEELSDFLADLLIIDLNLPGEDGISLTRRVRIAQPEIGIIMLTARGQVVDKLLGYETGADLYLIKPTSIEELGAAVQALSRRLKPQNQHTFLLNSTTLILQGPNNSVNLSANEARIISTFARALEHRLEYWQLMELSGNDNISKRTLEVQIVRLRKKLIEAGGQKHPIKSIRNVGYQLCVDVGVL